MKPSKKFPLLIILTAFLAVSAVSFHLFNRWEIIITPEGALSETVEFPKTYKDAGATAVYQSSLLPFLRKDIEVVTDNRVDTEKLGKYEVIYKASYKKAKETLKRTVTVKDTTPPEITLDSIPDYYTPYNHEYEEEGFHAFDRHDGDVTDEVKSEIRDGIVYYTVKDSSGNTAKAERKIIYDDRRPPELTFPDGKDIIIFKGDPFTDRWQAVDDCDGDVSANVKVEGTVDTGNAGTYELVYTISDEHGNITSVTRNITVRPRPINAPSGGDYGPKTIYLTFDDGPGESTGRLLDILDRYNVKATFFTTSMYGYSDYIAEEARRGHTVAVHTYSHNYASVYSSTDAYWQDYNTQKSVIEQLTGTSNNLFRFPGGSSNTVSANYSSGIMSRLVQEAEEKGLVYFDWNVSSGDAGSLTDSNAIAENIKAGITSCSNAGVPSIVLQHDYKPYTVDAVEPVILWALENGYEFRTLSDSSYYVHHGINN